MLWNNGLKQKCLFVFFFCVFAGCGDDISSIPQEMDGTISSIDGGSTECPEKKPTLNDPCGSNDLRCEYDFEDCGMPNFECRCEDFKWVCISTENCMLVCPKQEPSSGSSCFAEFLSDGCQYNFDTCGKHETECTCTDSKWSCIPTGNCTPTNP